MTKIKKIVATFVLFLIVFSFICVGTSFKPVASSSANSESQLAASPFHPTGLQPTQTPSQPATSSDNPTHHPACKVGYHFDSTTDSCAPDNNPKHREACLVGNHWDDNTGACVPDNNPKHREACLVGNHWDDNTGACVPDIQPTQPDSQSCLQSGGHVETQMCCKSASDFRNTCTLAIGACGCSSENSKETKVCDCGAGKCFDGTSCVPITTNKKSVWIDKVEFYVNGNFVDSSSGEVVVNRGDNVQVKAYGGNWGPDNADLTIQTGYPMSTCSPKKVVTPSTIRVATCSFTADEDKYIYIVIANSKDKDDRNFFVKIRCHTEGDSCTSDSQCCSGLTCQSGKCTQLQPCHTEGDSCTSDSQCCSGLTCQSGKCAQKPNGECNAGVLIQGQIVSIPNPCRDFQSGSACSFDVRIDRVLKIDYPYTNVVSGQTITVIYTSGSQKFDAQVGDCIEVCANWDTNLYCGDDLGYIKKIACAETNKYKAKILPKCSYLAGNKLNGNPAGWRKFINAYPPLGPAIYTSKDLPQTISAAVCIEHNLGEGGGKALLVTLEVWNGDYKRVALSEAGLTAHSLVPGDSLPDMNCFGGNCGGNSIGNTVHLDLPQEAIKGWYNARITVYYKVARYSPISDQHPDPSTDHSWIFADDWTKSQAFQITGP